MFRVFIANFLRLMPSTVEITICPPSNTGIGSKFITPRLIEKKTIQSARNPQSPVSTLRFLACLCEFINGDGTTHLSDGYTVPLRGLITAAQILLYIFRAILSEYTAAETTPIRAGCAPFRNHNVRIGLSYQEHKI